MFSKSITSLGISSLLSMGLQAAQLPQDTSDSNYQKTRPNILMLYIDDLVPALNTYGMDYAISPNIDNLAARSTVFQRAYCSVPVCGASRASLFTGIHPTTERFTAHNTRADEDVPNIKSVPEFFRLNGYETISIGKVFHAREDHAESAWSKPPIGGGLPHATMLDPDSENWIGGTRDRGPFYEIADVEDWDYPDGKVAERAIDELDQLNGSDNPFFLAVGFIRPHLPFYAPRKYWDLYDRDQIPLAPFRERPEGAPQSLRGSGEIRTYGDRGVEYNSDEFHRVARHGYLACVSYVDALVGYVLDALERNGFADNTIIVLLGDHGFHLGEHNFWGKHTLLHGALHTPFMISRPGQNPIDIYTPISLVDVAPTLLDLVAIEKPDYLHGHSFLDALDGDIDGLEGITYSHFRGGDAVVSTNWIYVEYFDTEEALLLDMKNDPQARRNALNDSDKASVVESLKARLNEFRDQANVLP